MFPSQAFELFETNVDDNHDDAAISFAVSWNSRLLKGRMMDDIDRISKVARYAVGIILERGMINPPLMSRDLLSPGDVFTPSVTAPAQPNDQSATRSRLLSSFVVTALHIRGSYE